MNQFTRHINKYEKLLRTSREACDKKSEAKANTELGNAYYSEYKYQEAIKYFEGALSIAIDICDKAGKGKACKKLGVVYQALAKYHEAEKYLKEGLSIAIEIGDKVEEAKAYGNLGVVCESLGKYDKAIEYQEKLRDIAKEIGDKNGEGTAYGNLGRVYLSQGKYEEAMKIIQKRLSIAKDLGDNEGEGAAYGDLGAAYRLQGKYDEAIKFQEMGLNIATEIRDKVREGAACGNLGVVFESVGKYDQAIKYQERNLNIAIEIGKKDEEGKAYGNLGIVYESLGKYDKAIECVKNGLRIVIEIGDKATQGAACGNLGAVYQSLGKFRESIKYYEKQLHIAKEIGDKAAEGAAYGNFGRLYKSVGKYDESIKYQEEQLRIATEIGDKAAEGVAYGNLGTVYHSVGKYDEAIKYQEKQLEIAIEVGDKPGEARALHNLGLCYFDSTKHNEEGVNTANCHDNLNRSAKYLEEALLCFECVFDHSGQDKYKVSIFDTFLSTYQVLMEVLIDLKQIEDALLIAERGRARALVDVLDAKYSFNKGYVYQTNPTTYNDIKSILPSSKSSVLFFALSKDYIDLWYLTHENSLGFHQKQIRPITSTVSGENQNSYRTESLAGMIDAVFEQMQVKVPVDCEDRSLDSLEEDEGQFERRDVAEEPLLISVHGNKVRLVSSDVQENLRPRCLWPEEDEDCTDHLEVLYETLVTPVQRDLSQEEVLIIPVGLLFKVPFAALRDPNTKLYLSDTKHVRLAPSLSILKVLQERPAAYHNRTSTLIVGNPDVTEVMVKGEKKKFIRLPCAAREALELGTLMGITPLIGAQATKQEVLHRLQNGVGVVHIAAHGSHEGKILLAPCPSVRGIPQEKDCFLTMDEVQESGCRAQLVVLSCCHSGRGVIRAEGVVGLTRAFLAAGARAVVASLWAIADGATMRFMVFFYTHLKSGESASASLQQAMKEMRKETSYTEPKFWAPFFLVGDDVTITIQDS